MENWHPEFKYFILNARICPGTRESETLNGLMKKRRDFRGGFNSHILQFYVRKRTGDWFSRH